MKNLILILTAVILLNSCQTLTNDKKVYQKRANELQNDGWSKKAATHIAKVESGLIPEDEEYISYMED